MSQYEGTEFDCDTEGCRKTCPEWECPNHPTCDERAWKDYTIRRMLL